MVDYGILSLVPPVIAIILAIYTRQVFVSLLFGIWLGWLVLTGLPLGDAPNAVDLENMGFLEALWRVVRPINLWEGSLNTIHALVDVLKPLNPDSVNKNDKISSKTAENSEKNVIHH